MKKLFFLVLAAAAAATATVSCETGVRGNSANGGKARMDLRISFPQTGLTRAADPNASVKDVTIETVTVFIFETDGSAAPGNRTSLTLADFGTPTNNVYALKASSRITTTPGTKHIYVGINLPTELSGATSESTLIDAASTGIALESTSTVAMLSGLAEKTLAEISTEDDPTPAGNVVEADVKRLVAKVSVKNSEVSYTPTTSSDDAPFTVTPDKFTVGNLATKFFPVQKLSEGVLTTPEDGGPDPDAAPIAYKAINAPATATTALDAFYIPEHKDMAGTGRQGSLSYVAVRAEVKPTKWAKMGGSGVEYTNVVSGDIVAGSPVRILRHEGNTYFCKLLGDYNGLKNNLGITGDVEYFEPDADGKIYTYYHLFLQNRDDEYVVERNSFIDYTITAVNDLGTMEEMPDEDVIVFETTYLEVSVDVLAWDHYPIDKVLGE